MVNISDIRECLSKDYYFCKEKTIRLGGFSSTSGPNNGEYLSRDLIPEQGIKLVVLSYDQFDHNTQKKIIRDRSRNLKIVRNILSEYLDS